MVELSEIQLGQTVELSDGRTATVQFSGNTHFAAGDWVGVVLDDTSGKNDGSVQGQRYFDCAQGHGMFIRPAAVAIVNKQPTPKPGTHMNGIANGAATKGRPSSVTGVNLRRQSVLDPTAIQRQSMNAASPTPAVRSSRLASPSKSPTKQLGSTGSSATSTPRTTTPSTSRKSILPPGKSIRTSMGPPPQLSSTTRASRPSIAGAMNGSAKPPGQTYSSLVRGSLSRPSMRPGMKERLESASGDIGASSGHESPGESQGAEFLSPTLSEPPEDRSRGALGSSLSQASDVSHAPSNKFASNRGRSPPTAQRPPTAGTVSSREVEDLKTKLRVMEKRRTEDRARLKEFEKIQADRDKFEGIIQKLQTKYQPQQQEITDLKRQLKEEEAKMQTLETQEAENETVVEVATLDREMAEETAESLKLELETLRQKHEEMELEVDVLREENQELGKEISPEEKTSQGWLQLERSNERLREALMRLRDVTQQQEADMREQISELETDVQDLRKTKENYVQTKESLLQSDTTVEELRQRLDGALGAEEMIEELTEKNLALNEKLNDLKATIEDLESLKELNDELEINHTETEKQLQDEVDYNEALLAGEARKSALQDGTIQDLEYTVTRFRDLVTNMQSELEDMRASQQISETEASELSSRSRAMMDLNLHLQNYASKTQVKAIDLELGKLEAQESAEHLAIVQLFLPDSFKLERNSVQALLRFRRIGFKSSMMHGFIKEHVNGHTSAGHEEDIFNYLDVLDKLTWVSSTCDRFINNIHSSNLEAFKRLEGASYELEPVERALNGWIEGLRRGELKGEQCAIELQRSIALISHLAEVHIPEDLEHYTDDVHVRAMMMQSNLENAAACLSHIKSMSDAKIIAAVPDNGDEDGHAAEFTSKIDCLISQSRSAKVITSKAIRQLEDLKSRSLSLESSTLNTVEHAQTATSDLSSSSRSLGVTLMKTLSESRDAPLTYEELMRIISPDQVSFSSLSTKLHSTTGLLQIFYNLTNSLTNTVEFPSPPPPPPWKMLAEKMRAASADIAARETEFGRLKDEVVEKNTTLALREKIAEEMSVKVEVLEKRVGETSSRREKVRELESSVEAAKSKERDLLSKLTHLQRDLQSLEAERETWKQNTKAANTTMNPWQDSTAGVLNAATSEASLRQIEALKTEVKTLQSSIRYLRSASHSHFLSASYNFLSTPITPSHSPPPLIESEARDVLKEMLNLTIQPANTVVKLHPRPKEDRLRWRPARETSTWQVQKQKEEWAEWREWSNTVAKKAVHTRRENARQKEVRNLSHLKHKGALASVQMRLPGKVGPGQQVQIVRPGDWEEVEEMLGITAR